MQRPLRRVRRAVASVAGAAILASGLASFGASGAAAADPEFPAGQEAFHTYAEIAAEVQAAATAYPSIVERFSIGKSYKGRDLWAVKVSDNVGTDEAEPEVLIDGLHHADEHMSLEMTLAILRWLTEGYGTSTRITNIVDSREIWIIFAMNPDGATYDIRDGRYHSWRKNRQPTSGSTSIGTDLNRNYDYRWGCCGGASSTPSSSRYRGTSAFSAPETRAFRNFVRSRVIDGRQQIRVSASFHTTGRLVMWPYGYTTTNVPADMTRDDAAALTAIGKTMAASNGYKPEQASDLYITSGTSRDWLYGRYRVFAYTIELSPDSTPYPKASAIPTETGRNKSAVLYLMERAACPYSVIDKERTRCGAFDDDLEVARGCPVPSSWGRCRPAPRPSSPRTRRAPAQAPTTWTAVRPRSSHRRSTCPPLPARGSPFATISPTARTHPVPTSCASRSSRTAAPRRPSSSNMAPRTTTTRHGQARRSRSTPGPARRSGSGSRHGTAAHRA
jgi:carboxypeptidase T